jgi:hypothetical protein
LKSWFPYEAFLFFVLHPVSWFLTYQLLTTYMSNQFTYINTHTHIYIYIYKHTHIYINIFMFIWETQMMFH